MNLLKEIEKRLNFQSTRTKLSFVSIVSKCVIVLRRMLGKTDQVIKSKRMKVWWSLDLNEAIDCCLYVFNNYEPELIKDMNKTIIDGSIILDIGANFGVHSLVLGSKKTKSKIFAIEATDFAFKKLVNNIELNPRLNNINAQQIYLSSLKHQKDITVSASWNIRNMKDDNRNKLDGGFAKSIESAKQMTLDEWVIINKLERVDFIKLDVDGNELDVLLSAKNVLKDLNPFIYIELSPIHFESRPEDFDKIIYILKDNNYKLRDMFGNKLPLVPDEIRKIIPYGSLINALAYK